MTIFPPFSEAENAFTLPLLKETLLEPFLSTMLALFWLAALLAGALFSTAITAYDQLASCKSTALRTPYLRGNPTSNPLLLTRRDSARRTPLPSLSARNRTV